MSVKELNSIKQNVTDFVERYIEVEQFLNITSSFVNPVKDIHISTIQDINKAALKVRSEWQLGLNALSNVVDVLEDKNIKLIEVDAPDEFDGFSGWADDKIPIIVINKNYKIERKRLTALHELGHLILNLKDGISTKEKERFCFQFAGAMLIPESTFKNELGNVRSYISVPELVAVKETYGISIQAIMARAKDLKVINESQFISFRKFITQNRTEEGMGNYIGREQTFRFNQLVNRAAAENVISMSKAANLSNMKLSEFRKEFVVL